MAGGEVVEGFIRGEETGLGGSKKHNRSGGGGEVSPLARQLQQVWFQTQVPKAAKRSGYADRALTLTKSAAYSHETYEPSAHRSLSSIFPELRSSPDVSDQRQPIISSVFTDGDVANGSLVVTLPCIDFMFPEFAKESYALTASPLSPGFQGHSGGPTHVQRSVLANSVDRPTVSSMSSEHSSSPCLSSSNSFSDDSVQQGLFSPGFSDAPTSAADLDPNTASDLAEETLPLLSFLNDILMDENLEEKKCMFQECSAYQAMARELGDLIGYDSTTATPPSCDGEPKDSQEGELDSVDSWIDEVLSGPLPRELGDGCKEDGSNSFGDEVGSGGTSFSPTTVELERSNLWANNGEYQTNVRSAGPDRNDPEMTVTKIGITKYGGNLPSWQNGASKSHPAPETDIVAHISSSELTSLLVSCAQAIGQNDFSHANELIGELRQHSSPYGSGLQRCAHYFMEALVARMSGTGGQLYTALSRNRPSAATMLKAYRNFVDHHPFIVTSHFFGNRTILDAFKDASHVHVVDYGILYGVQWPCLIHNLAIRPGGPPHLRITGIDNPQPGFRPTERILETGQRLADIAKAAGVPFEFHALAEKWEAITPAHLFLRKNEVLAVNCMFRLRHLLDESVIAASPRKIALDRIRSMNPKVFVQGVVSSGYNSPFFLSRFREALNHYTPTFDALESTMPVDDVCRSLLEREIMGREILNIVACEGLERVERAESYKQWQSRTQRAGFRQKPLDPAILAKIRSMMGAYHRDFGIGEDGGWFLMGWKGHVCHGLTIWEPTPTEASA